MTVYFQAPELELYSGCRSAAIGTGSATYYNITDIEQWKSYKPCPGLYDGFLLEQDAKIFFFRQGSASTPEQWSISGSTLYLNKRAMTGNAMGKVFWMDPNNSGNSLMESETGDPDVTADGTGGAPQGRYRIAHGRLFVSDTARDGRPLYVQDIDIEIRNYYYEVYGPDPNNLAYGNAWNWFLGHFTSEVPISPYRYIGPYLYYRYNDGESWTKIDISSEVDSSNVLGSRLQCCVKDPLFSDEFYYGPIYSYNITSSSGSWPDGSRSIQLTGHDASKFIFLEDYIAENYTDIDPVKVSISQVTQDGSWNTYNVASITDNGDHYAIEIDTSDLLGDLAERFTPEEMDVHRFKPYDTSGDPAGAHGTPEGFYTVRDGKFCISTIDRTGDEWFSWHWGKNYREAVWYWRYTEGLRDGKWIKHVQTTGTESRGGDGVDYGASLRVKAQGSSNILYRKKLAGEAYTTHFEATDQPANFPDGTREIEVTSYPRSTNRLFVTFDADFSWGARLVVEETIKQEKSGSFYSQGTSVDPNQLIGISDPDTGAITWTSQAPTREGQVITLISPTNQAGAAMFISVETSPGVFEWKSKA